MSGPLIQKARADSLAGMGLSYFGGKSWAQITREERFFCLALYQRINAEGVSRFVQYLRDAHGYALDPGKHWEVAFEACFYRDLWHHRERKGALFSMKRTFDLALFSDDVIVIIEAKAAEAFDALQTATFIEDKAQVIAETGVKTVLLVGLCSSRYTPAPALAASFDGPILSWSALAAHYDDSTLQRADDVFEQARVENNLSGHMTGAALVAAFDSGARFFVGRARGEEGARRDAETGSWRGQQYETNREALEPPNRNWFSLEAFVRMVRPIVGGDS